MTGWTEMPALARKGQQVLVTAIATPDTGKAIVQDATVKKPVNDFLYIRTEKTVLFLKALIIDLFKCLKMILNALIILRVPWFTWLINGRRVGYCLFFLKQDEDMPDSIYCKLN